MVELAYTHVSETWQWGFESPSAHHMGVKSNGWTLVSKTSLVQVRLLSLPPHDTAFWFPLRGFLRCRCAGKRQPSETTSASYPRPLVQWQDSRPISGESRFESVGVHHPGELSGTVSHPPRKRTGPLPRGSGSSSLPLAAKHCSCSSAAQSFGLLSRMSPVGVRPGAPCPHSLMDQSPSLRSWLMSPFKSGWGYQSWKKAGHTFLHFIQGPGAQRLRQHAVNVPTRKRKIGFDSLLVRQSGSTPDPPDVGVGREA